MRPLALALALSLALPPQARGEDLECALPTDAPVSYSRLRWRGPDAATGEGAPGFWVSDKAMQEAAERVDGCKNVLATCRTDLIFEQAKRRSPRWYAWAIGVAAGVAIGYYAAEKL